MSYIINPGFTPRPFSVIKVGEIKNSHDTSTSPLEKAAEVPIKGGKAQDGELANSVSTSPLKEAGRTLRSPTAEEPNHLQYDTNKLRNFSLVKRSLFPSIKQDVASFSEAIAGAKTPEELNSVITELQAHFTSIEQKNRGDLQQDRDSRLPTEAVEQLLNKAQDKLSELENASETGTAPFKAIPPPAGHSPPLEAHSATISSQPSLPHATQHTPLPLGSNIEKFQAHSGSLILPTNVNQPTESAKAVKIIRPFSREAWTEFLSRMQRDPRAYFDKKQSPKDDSTLFKERIQGTKTPGIREFSACLSDTRAKYSKGSLEKIPKPSKRMLEGKGITVEQGKNLAGVTQSAASTVEVERFIQNSKLMELAQALLFVTNLKELSFPNDPEQALIQTVGICCRDKFSAIVKFNRMLLSWREHSLGAAVTEFLSSRWLRGLEDTINDWNLAAFTDINIDIHHWFMDNRVVPHNGM